MYIYTNPNPNNTLVGDCTVRAIALLLDRLEQMVDEAKTDYERQVIETWIDRLSSEQY